MDIVDTGHSDAAEDAAPIVLMQSITSLNEFEIKYRNAYKSNNSSNKSSAILNYNEKGKRSSVLKIETKVESHATEKFRQIMRIAGLSPNSIKDSFNLEANRS